MSTANTQPIFSRIGMIGINNTALGTASYRLSGAATDYAGTDTTKNQIILTADATNGSYVSKIRFKALGNNATAAVARIFINNGLTQGTASNNAFFGEISLPIVTASTTAATVDIDYPMNIVLPAGYRLIVGVSSSADESAGWIATAVAGAY